LIVNKMNLFDEIKKEFTGKSFFSQAELFDFLEQHFFADLKETTFRWRIYELKKAKVISVVGKSLYKISEQKDDYKPFLVKKHHQINLLLKKEFPESIFCLWNTNWFNQFSRHQSANDILIVEVEKELVLPFFYLIQDKGLQNVFVEPDENTMEKYVLPCKESIIVKSLISKSPLKEINKINVPKLEKLLVDLVSDYKYLNAYHAHEQITIFKNALAEFEINFTTMLNYSSRRKKNKLIRNILLEEVNVDKELIG